MDDYDMCDYCTCCSREGCHRGEGSQCPTSYPDGEYLCPCTEES